MSNSKLSSMAVPVAGITLGAFLVLYLAKDAFTNIHTPPCSGRYPSATEFALMSESSTPLSAIELQARAGSDDWGVLENARVMKAFHNAPSPLVLQVRLPKGSTSMYQAAGNGGGLTFRWQPRAMEGATSACLSYSVYVPPGFDFGKGGELPGLFGGKDYKPATPADGVNGFASRPVWGVDGKGEMRLQTPSVKGGLSQALGAPSFKLERERWISIEQETVLNTPGLNNGVARIWVDGVLKTERSKIAWRKDKSLTLSGVINDVWYGGLDSKATAPTDTFLALTPATVSWK